MTDQLQTKPVPFATAEPAEPVDLSGAIATQIDKRPADRVTVRWIYGCNYRCNWWAPGDTREFDNPAMPGLTVTTHRVRKSRFLRVTQTPQGLAIVDVSATSVVR